MSARLRCSFVRDVLGGVERSGGREALVRLDERLPERLRQYLALKSVHVIDPTVTIPLDEGEELLLAVDATLGDGSGRVLESAALEVASRMLSNEATVVQPRDLIGTVARMQASLERPFVDVPVVFDLQRTERGFSLAVGVRGRPRSSRVLRHLAAGYIRAADRFAMENAQGRLRIYAEQIGDRATLTALYRASSIPAPAERATAERPVRPSRRMRMTSGTLSQEVERIMVSTRSSVVGEEPSSARAPHSPNSARRPPSAPMGAVRPPSVPPPPNNEDTEDTESKS